MTQADPFGHFLEAQDAVFADVVGELRGGTKTGHWMWFVFPQIAGLGHSAMSRRYALASQAQARAYYLHPVLGPRLLQCCALLLSHPHATATAMLGETDALKLRSSMTLFHQAAPECSVFADVLAAFYAGQPDPRTLKILQVS